MTAETRYIVMTAKQTENFISARDRAYFSRPVAVQILATKLHPYDGQTIYIVRDVIRGCEFPCLKSSLKSLHALTNREFHSIQDSYETPQIGLIKKPVLPDRRAAMAG